MNKKVHITKIAEGVELHTITEETPKDLLLNITSKNKGYFPVTDFTITFCVLKEDNFFSLPKETQRLIGLYASDFKRTGSHAGFSIATYRLKELGFEFNSEGKVVWEKNKAQS